MKKVVDDPRLMIRVCDLYYNREASLQEISAELGLSRPTINRLLASAKEAGIVRISIPDLDAVRYWDLEQQLRSAYGLKEVIVSDPGNSQEEMLESLGKAAAGYLQHVIRDGFVVGMSMGVSLFETVGQIKAPGVSETVFVPLIGGMGKLRMELHANPLAQRMAELYKGDFYPLHAPARVSGNKVRAEILREESIAAAMRQMRALDVAVVGIGCPSEQSVLKATGLFEQKEIDTLTEEGAVGEVCLQFYDENGDTKAFKENRQVIGLDTARLRRVPLSVGIAGGQDKAAAIRGAVQGRMINVLITDSDSAKALLRLRSEETADN